MKSDSVEELIQTIFVVDDDEAIRDSLSMLITSVGLRVLAFSSANEFLESYSGDTGVLILDVRMPGMSGLELQSELLARNIGGLAILFMSGHADIPMAVEALKRGATDFLQKPFRDQDLLDRIHTALELNTVGLKRLRERQEIAAKLKALTPREQQIMEMVADGKANKVIAMDLDISQRTVELHRSHMMEKMGVRSLAQLVRTLERAKAGGSC
ncbi:MAG: response regulator transcription factor [Gammaproteobacteria bacterium]